MIIRAATLNDSAAIAGIKVDTWRSTYNGLIPQTILDGLSYVKEREKVEGWLRNMPPGRFLLVSEYSPGTVAGFVFGGPERTSFFSPKEPDSLVDTGCSTVNSFHIRRSKYKRYEDYKSEIYAVYVLKEFQRMGIGRNLLKHAAKTLLKSELTSMLAWTLKASPYRTFYEKLGGILIDEKKTGDFGIKTQLVAYGWNDTMPLIQADRQTAR